MSKKKKIRRSSWRLIKVKENFQITIPKEACKILGFGVGDFLGARIEDQKLVMIPKILISKEETILSKSGEKKLKEALDDVKEGRIEEA